MQRTFIMTIVLAGLFAVTRSGSSAPRTIRPAG